MIIEKTGGEIKPLGDFFRLRYPGEIGHLCHLQMVFQNPEDALILPTGVQPLPANGNLIRKSNGDLLEVARLLQSVGLPAGLADRFPGQLSGGEIQRIALARAFASLPDLLVADEPLSALDVSVQATILNLLAEFQSDHGTSLLFISHNLEVVAYLADVVAVIYLGHLMEFSKAADSFDPPDHPYTEALLASIPSIDPSADQKAIRLSGEIPSPLEIPSGCPFHTRCPRTLGDICVQEKPPWRTVPENGKRYFCHIPVDELRAVQALPADIERSRSC
jgi:peptide/nickel transport system ATP-binding protein